MLVTFTADTPLHIASNGTDVVIFRAKGQVSGLEFNITDAYWNATVSCYVQDMHMHIFVVL